MLLSDIKMNQACRTCLNEDDTMQRIHSLADIKSMSNSNITFADILMEICTTIKICPDDNLPQLICTNCVTRVQDAFTYKKMCENSDERLRNYFNTESFIELKPTLHIDENGTNSIFVPEIVDFNNTYEHDDLYDENMDDEHFDGDIFDRSPLNSDTEQKMSNEFDQPNKSIELNECKYPSTSSQTTSNDDGEDFRLVNRAQKINGRYQCELCEKTLADRRTFLLHTRLHLGKNLKHCNICGKGFAKKNHLDRHQKVHALKTKKAGKNHKSKKKVECDKVKTDKDANDLKNDNSNDLISGDEQMKIEKQDQEITQNDQDIKSEHILLNRVQSIPYDDDEQKLIDSAKQVNGRLQCPICPRTLSQRKILKLHIRSHLGKNLLYCKVCNRGFAKGSNLNRHMLLHCTIDTDEENQIIQSATQSNGSFRCKFCAKTLVDRQTFRLHIRLHISKGLLRCEICNRGFEDNDELQKHMTSHGNEFNCNSCDQVFETYHERKHHIRSMHNTSICITEQESRYQDRKHEDDEDKHIVNKSNCVNGRFECAFCKKTLANRTTLKYHIRLHLGKNLLTCDICQQGFSKKSHIKRHMVTHVKKKPCRFCDAVFETHEERKNHSADVHKDMPPNHSNKTIIVAWTQSNGKKQCICMICNQTFDQIIELKHHLDWHKNDGNSFDGIDFSVNENIVAKFDDLNRENPDIASILHKRIQQNPIDFNKLHCITNEHGWELSLTDSETENECYDETEIKTEAKYNCGKCQLHFNRVHKLMCHMKVDHNSIEFQKFKCSYCMQNFPNNWILAKHLRQQCENPNKRLVCLLCNNRFTWQSSLDKHVATYHQVDSKYIIVKQTNIRPFNCDQCIKSFYRKDHLETHKLSHVPQPKKFACHICQKRFSRTDNLKSHMRIHIPIEEREVINKHLCSYCGRSFSNSSNLTVHIRRHTGERPFSCEFCSARFPRSSDLACHRRTHTGEKTCVCTVCGKGFTRSNKLVRHMRIHTGERPYKCSHCGRAFTQSNDLTLHVRRHTGDKPFGCYCGERFITNSLLQSHRRSAGHMDESSTSIPSNSVNNPHRNFSTNDGKRTGITATLSNYLDPEIGVESDIKYQQK